MKRAAFIRQVKQTGSVFVRRGGKHDWYQNPKTKVSQPVPRHREIADSLAKHILKMLGD